MSFIQNLFGNATETSAEKIQGELAPILIENESVVMAFQVFRDLTVMTTFRLILVDKQGVTGGKREFSSIPYKSIKKFSCETAGFLDGDGEIRIWLTGEPAPLKWELSRSVNIRDVYRYLSHFVLTA